MGSYEVKSGWITDESGENVGIWFERSNDIVRRVLNFEERATRQALIALGWTPPDGI